MEEEDYSPPCTAHERMVLDKNGEKSKQVKVSMPRSASWSSFWAEDEAISIRSLAENARKEEGKSKFVLLRPTSKELKEEVDLREKKKRSPGSNGKGAKVKKWSLQGL